MSCCSSCSTGGPCGGDDHHDDHPQRQMGRLARRPSRGRMHYQGAARPLSNRHAPGPGPGYGNGRQAPPQRNFVPGGRLPGWNVPAGYYAGHQSQPEPQWNLNGRPYHGNISSEFKGGAWPPVQTHYWKRSVAGCYRGPEPNYGPYRAQRNEMWLEANLPLLRRLGLMP